MTGIDAPQNLMEQGVYITAIGTLLAGPPDHEQLATLAEESMFEAVPFAENQAATQEGLRILSSWAQTYDETCFESLKYDYLRLFEGPGMPKAAPWESVYLNEEKNLIFQQETLLVREWFRAYGQRVPLLYKEPDDHIAFELQFVGFLTVQAAEALGDGHEAKAREYLAARGRFCSEHLLKWGCTWCIIAKEGAASDYYAGLSWLVEGMLNELDSQQGAAKQP